MIGLLITNPAFILGETSALFSTKKKPKNESGLDIRYYTIQLNNLTQLYPLISHQMEICQENQWS